MDRFCHGGVEMAYRRCAPSEQADQEVQLFFAHGWGHQGSAFDAIAASFTSRFACYQLDFPGFGSSPKPPDDWGTAAYGDFAAAFLAGLPRAKCRIWIGHSFGCRIGIRLSAQHPESVDKMVLLAAAGLPRLKSAWQAFQGKLRVVAYKILRRLLARESWRQALQQRFGSQDYLNAGALRPIFLNVVRENLTEAAQQVLIPVALVCGSEDKDAPPDISERLAGLMPEGQFIAIPGLDHYTILSTGKHQAAHQIHSMIGS